MADQNYEQTILDFIERAEYLKEIARQEASQLVNDVDAEKFLDDPDGAIEAMLAALLAALDQYAQEIAEAARTYAVNLGFDLVDAVDIEAVVNDEEHKFILVALPSLTLAAESVATRIESMIASGVSADALETALSSDATKEALFSTLEAALKSAASAYLQELVRAVVTVAVELKAGQDAQALFEWVAVMDGHTCDDAFENSCAPRHAQRQTLAEWDDAGRPGAPQLICSMFSKTGSNCRCVLMITDEASEPKVLNPVDVSAAIRDGRQRAVAMYA